MQPLGGGFGGFDRQHLQRVRDEIAAGILRGFGPDANSGAGSDDEQGDGGRGSGLRRQYVVGEAKAIGPRLALERKVGASGARPPGANRCISLPEVSASKNCQTTRTLA